MNGVPRAPKAVIRLFSSFLFRPSRNHAFAYVSCVGNRAVLVWCVYSEFWRALSAHLVCIPLYVHLLVYFN